MDKGYIAPEPALRKLRAANGLGQTVYIYGATGYGKTELVKQYLSKRRYRYISSAEDAAGLLDVAAQGDRKGKGAETRTVVAVDDLHLLKDQEGRRAVLSLIKREDVWLILICRSPIPAWLMPPYVGGGGSSSSRRMTCGLGKKRLPPTWSHRGLVSQRKNWHL